MHSKVLETEQDKVTDTQRYTNTIKRIITGEWTEQTKSNRLKFYSINQSLIWADLSEIIFPKYCVGHYSMQAYIHEIRF